MSTLSSDELLLLSPLPLRSLLSILSVRAFFFALCSLSFSSSSWFSLPSPSLLSPPATAVLFSSLSSSSAALFLFLFFLVRSQHMLLPATAVLLLLPATAVVLLFRSSRKDQLRSSRKDQLQLVPEVLQLRLRQRVWNQNPPLAPRLKLCERGW